MIQYLKQLIAYEGNPSSKRFIGIISGLSLVAYMFINPSESANNSVLILSLGALGITAYEKLLKNKIK